MRFLNTNTRLKLNEIISKINQKQYVSLSERIYLNKYANKYPYMYKLIKEDSLKFS